MKGVEPIALFCSQDPWLVAAVEVAGIHICRSFSWGENEQERTDNLISTTRQIRRAAPNILLNPFIQPQAHRSFDNPDARVETLIS